MNINEQIVKDALEDRGFTVFRNGWPDFLCVRDIAEKPGIYGNPATKGVMTVEVKANGDKIREEQQIVHKILRAVRIPVHVLNPKIDFKNKLLATRHVLTPGEVWTFEKEVRNVIEKEIPTIEKEISMLQEKVKQLQEVAKGVCYFEKDMEPLLLPLDGLK